MENHIDTMLWWLSSAEEADMAAVDKALDDLYKLLVENPNACNFLPGFPSQDAILSQSPDYTPKQVAEAQFEAFLESNAKMLFGLELEAGVRYALSVWERVQATQHGGIWPLLWLVTYLVIHPEILGHPKFKEAKRWLYEKVSAYRRTAAPDRPDPRTYRKILDATRKFLKGVEQGPIAKEELIEKEARRKNQKHALLQLLTGENRAVPMSSLKMSTYLHEVNCMAQTSKDKCKSKKECTWNDVMRKCMSRRSEPSRAQHPSTSLDHIMEEV